MLFAKLFQPMGGLFKEEEIRSVFLAESADLIFPADILRSGRLGNPAPIRPNQGLVEEEKAGAGFRDITPVTRAEVEEYLSSLSSRAVPSEPAVFQIDPELLEQFQLAPPDESRFQLSISPGSERETEKSQRESLSDKDRLDFLIPYAAGTSTKLKKLLASSRPAGGFSTDADRISSQRTQFDIQAWALKAIAEIEMNWTFDPLLGRSLSGVVGISVTISRSGEIRSTEIVKSSGHTSLDLIALNALEASDPLPGLTKDFPEQILTLYLEFEYGK